MKKQQQLGMNPGTASGRLVKDLLFQFVVKAGHKCFRCGGELTRDTFSIEHKKHWLDSGDPIGRFFDLNNIAYSHQGCNSGASRRPNQVYFTAEAKKEAVRGYRVKSRNAADKAVAEVVQRALDRARAQDMRDNPDECPV